MTFTSLSESGKPESSEAISKSGETSTGDACETKC